MTADALPFLRSSFEHVARQPDEAARLFYRRLFELDPTLRPLFRNDFERQKQKLMTSLVELIQSIDQPERLERQLLGLAERHLVYGVRPEHLPLFGEALLWMLEALLRTEFTREVRAAWKQTCAEVVGTTMGAMERLSAKPA